MSYMKEWKQKNPNYWKEHYINNKDKYRESYNRYLGQFIYKFVDDKGEVVRIGSTNNMMMRMSQYFNGYVFDDISVKELLEMVDKVMYIDVTDAIKDRRERLAMEYTLIKMEGVPKLNKKEGRNIEEIDYIDNTDWREWDISNFRKKL